MKTQTTVYLSEQDREKAENLMKFYSLNSLGKLIRVLIQSENNKVENIKNS